MADQIKCPVCGESNTADQEFCQYCQSRLRPLTGSLRGADAPLHPGQVPTKKVTAELEPILPQWLREARDKARHSAEDDASQTIPVPPQVANAAEPDLLAGLRSQSRDDEVDTPDWLANITGVASKSKKVDPASSEARRVELGDRDDFARDTAPLQEHTPTWLANMQAASEQQGEKDELKDWFRESSGVEQKKADAAPRDSEGWFGQQTIGASSDSGSDSPDWLKQMSAEGDLGNASAPAWLDPEVKEEVESAGPSPFGGSDVVAFDAGSSSEEYVPGWLQGADSKTPAADGGPDSDWLRGLETPKIEPPLKKHTTPLWLKGKENSDGSAAELETPVWLDDSSTPSSLPAIESQPDSLGDAGFGDIPNWLKAAAPQSSIYDEAPADQAPVVPPEATGWLSTFRSSEPAAPPTPFPADHAEENTPPPAFTPDAFKDGSADALFTEMPDWLSNVGEPASSSASTPAISENIIPGELPSWVQAMRPVDSGMSRPTPAASDETLETRGALSGLQGVLPAVPGFGPSSKPKVHSIKLQATHEQQAHAALLEQILAAEAEPVPITSFSPLRTSRSLRWFISVTVAGLILGAVSLNTRIFAMPVGVPNEFNGALQVAQTVPEGAPVLVAMDYHPARAGEMEAAAAPMFDQMIVLRHPRLTFVSTNEMGPLLAERFISETLAERGYQYGSQYLNLGYLPGGVMGIRSFTQNPPQAIQFDIFLNQAWQSAPLQGVATLSQFAALIVITDNTDSARAWIEQSVSTRGSAPLVFITSAQVAPMIQPYYDSGQVNGIVNGLYGGAIFEQNNAGRPGTARNYWDAYSLGMLLAMVLMLGGGLWSAALGLRDRAQPAGGR